jgi:alanine racemase
MVGRISMDVTLVDVTDVPGVEIGDEVVLIGASGSLSITAWDHAKVADTIPYEVLCNISKRVARKYVE